jgi:hypothetical protein
MNEVADRGGAAPTGLTIRETELMEHLEALERLFDRQFRIPGVPVRIGLDSILGLIPVAGDTLSAGASLYLIWLAHRVGADSQVKTRMIGNAAVDYALGLVPLVGDVGDVFFKANTRNVRLLKEHLRRKGRLHSAAAPPAAPPRR